MTKQPVLRSAQSATLVALMAAVLSLSVAAAHAAETSAVNATSFKVFDSNLDGVIDKKEAEADPSLLKAFDPADADKNGRLDPGEYAKAFSMK